MHAHHLFSWIGTTALEASLGFATVYVVVDFIRVADMSINE